MKIKIIIMVALISIIAIATSIYTKKAGSTLTEEKKEITINYVETMHGFLDAAKTVMEAQGYKVNLVVISKNRDAIASVNDGSADCAMAVHKMFMESYNKANNGDLVMVEPYAYNAGMGLYSLKHAKLDDIPNEAKIAIMDDAMNMDRGLKMLRDAGLIKLNEADGQLTQFDISENPKNIKFIEMDQTQTVRSMEDLDASVVFFGHVAAAKLNPRSYIVRDLDGVNYPIALVVKEINRDAKWAKDFAEAFRSDSVRKVIAEKYDGVYEIYE